MDICRVRTSGATPAPADPTDMESTDVTAVDDIVEAVDPADNPVRHVRRRRWRRLRRFALWALGVVVVLALVASGLVVWSVRRSCPEYDGTVAMSGLAAPVTVYRDSYGVGRNGPLPGRHSLVIECDSYPRRQRPTVTYCMEDRAQRPGVSSQQGRCGPRAGADCRGGTARRHGPVDAPAYHQPMLRAVEVAFHRPLRVAVTALILV